MTMRPTCCSTILKGKKFEEVGLATGVAYPESGAFISGMGADFKDIDNDGWDDIWHTAIEGESFPLFKNAASGDDFREITNAGRLGHPTREMSGWSNGVFDFDNDGWKDLFVARGNVQTDLARTVASECARAKHRLSQSCGQGRFEDVSTAGRTGFSEAGAPPGRGIRRHR